MCPALLMPNERLGNYVLTKALLSPDYVMTIRLPREEVATAESTVTVDGVVGSGFVGAGGQPGRISEQRSVAVALERREKESPG